MALFSWLRQRAGGQVDRTMKQNRGAASRFRPRLEALEDRWLPSTLTVLNTNDSGAGSLRAQIAAAQSRDTIVFAANIRYVALTSGELAIDKSLTIDGGPGGLWSVQVDVPFLNSRALDITSSTASVTLDNVLVTEGFAQNGGAIMNAGALTLNHCSFDSNGAAQQGGALDNSGTAVINNCTFDLVIADGNYATDGGAIENYGIMTITGGEMGHNTAQGYQGHHVTGNGGGIDNHGTLTISGLNMGDNFAHESGGDIANAGILTVTGSSFGFSGADEGGNIANFGYATVATSIFTEASGGGVFNAGTMIISNTTIEGGGFGQSVTNGGGIDNTGTLTLSASTVTGNTATADGGGIYNTGTLYVTNGSNVTGNSAPGGADVYNLGTLQICSDSTVGVIGP